MKGVMKIIKNLTTDAIDELDEVTLRQLVVEGSKLVNQNLRRLKNSKYSNISKLLVMNDGEIKVKGITMQNAMKMTKTKLRQKLREITRIRGSVGASIRETKKYKKKMESKGIDVEKLTKSDWDSIRRLIEEEMAVYNSEEVIRVYTEMSYKDRVQVRKETKQSDWYEKLKEKRQIKKWKQDDKKKLKELLELEEIPNEQKDRYQKAKQTRLLKHFGFDKDGKDLGTFDKQLEDIGHKEELGAVFNLYDLYNL